MLEKGTLGLAPMKLLGHFALEGGDRFLVAVQRVRWHSLLCSEPLTLFGGDQNGNRMWSLPTGDDLGLILPSIKPWEPLWRALITLGLILHRKGGAKSGCPSGYSQLCLGGLGNYSGLLGLDSTNHKDLPCFLSILNPTTSVNLIYIQKR